MIRPAILSDLDSIKHLTEMCAEALREKNVFQWNENYPSRVQLGEDIERNELFLEENSLGLAGIIVVSTKMDEVYKSVDWLTPSDGNIYIHRLAVNPLLWGEGLGQNLMNFGEAVARERGVNSVRLDTFSQNKRNQRFYELRGYQRLGEIYFPMKSEYPFICYEKILK